MNNIAISRFFWALLFIVPGILPIIGLLLIFSKIEVEKWVLNLIKSMIPMGGIAYFLLGELTSPCYPCHEIVFFYSFVMPLFLHFLQLRNPDKNTKVLAVFLVVSHLFCQYWEIPVFIAGHLGIFGAEYLGSIDQLYLILVFYLAMKYAAVSIDRETIMYLSIPMITSSIALCLLPIGKPQMPLGYIVRGISCFCLGKVFVDRSVL